MTRPQETKRRGLKMTRRRMILGSGFAGGVLAVGYTLTHFGDVAAAALSYGADKPDPSAFGQFIEIAPDGWVTVINRHQEMGQGTHAALAAMVAEELDADWNKVRIKAAPANMSLYRGPMGFQGTAGSTATGGAWDQLRNAGAAARAMFVEAAAQGWSVPTRTLRVQNSVVSHNDSGRSAAFAELLPAAAKRTPPQRPVLKDPRDYRLIGTDRVRRKDSLGKSTGATRYTQDVRLPGMLIAMVAHSPRFGGKVARVDATAARKVSGVVDVIQIPSGVAVLAENTYAAHLGRNALKVEWDDKAAEMRSSEQILDSFRAMASGRTEVKPSSFQKKGDPAKAFHGKVIELSFDFPYLAHIPMETMDCVAQVDHWRVKLVSASQMPTLDQINAARTVLTIPGDVAIDVLPAGGSFGRRGVLTSDYVVECLSIARHTNGKPVKLIWTREDDMGGGYYRPLAHHRLWIELDAAGFPAAWRHHTVAQSLAPFGPNTFAIEGIKDSAYFSTASVVDGQVFSPKLEIPVGFWRSVGHSHTAMVMEHAVEQLARRANCDSADYRRALYRKAGDKRRLAVLDLACEKAGWGTPMEHGWARGLAVHESFGTVVAQIAEVKLANGKPTVRRVVAAVDCGLAVAPDQVASQMEGAVNFGLSAALYGGVTLRNGVIERNNFHSYKVVRMNEAPHVETHIVRSTQRPSGMGEPGTPLIAPAIANALLVLTGKTTTSLPFVTS